MKIIKEGGQKYAAGIDKALRRAAQQAELTAAATGTRLVIYENGKIRRVRPEAGLNTVKMMRDIGTELPRHFKDSANLELKQVHKVRKNLGVRRAEGKHTSAAEKRAKYGSR